jgi:Fe-S cluster assembly protein SufD
MNAMTSESYLHYLDDFLRHKGTLPGQHLPWLARLREEALKQFLSTGFPALRDEDWKYTSVAPIENGRFTLATGRPEVIDIARIEALALSGAHLLVFVDGRHAPALSRIDTLPAEVNVASLDTMLESQPECIEAQFSGTAPYPSSFAALNAACMTDGAYIHLAQGAVLDRPIHLLFVTSSANLAAHPRNLLVAEPDSRASIVEHHIALGSPTYFTNAVTKIVLGRGAQIEHHKLQQESSKAFHIAAISAELAENSRFVSNSYALGSALARTDIQVGLNGEGAECTLDGLYMANGRQHIDHHTRIDHSRPRGTSREFYKGVLGGASRAVFNGKVIVHPGAQQSDAAQTNRNLLLSGQAEIDTKPQLEIWADDVKCSHGATVGQLDADQIFYLRSRGMDDAAARALLIYAFAAEMVERVALQPLRERLDGLLRGWMPQQLKVLP